MEPSDFELLAKWQAGDTSAGNHLFERHFVAAHMMHVTLPDLDLSQPLVLRAGGF